MTDSGDVPGPWRSVLGLPQFRALLVARALAVTGSALSPVAMAFAVLEVGGSAAALGLVLVVRQVAQVLCTLLAGALADRLPRFKVLVGADVVAGLGQSVAAVSLLTGRPTVSLLAATAAVNGAASAFVLPAVNGLVPQVVPREHLPAANACLRMSYNICSVTGISIAGVVVAAAGAGVAVALDALTFFLSAVAITRLRTVTGSLTAGPGLWGLLRAGWHEFSSRRWLVVMVGQATVFNLVYVGALAVLGPVVALESFGGAVAWSVIAVGHNVGYLLGGLVSARLRRRRPLLIALTAMALEVPFIASLGVVPALGASPVVGCAVVAAFAVLGGLGIEIFGVMWDSTVQAQIPNVSLSRVSSYDQLASLALVPLGLAMMGPLADGVGAGVAAGVAAAVMAVSIVAALATGSVRRLGAPRAAVGAGVRGTAGGSPT